METQSDVKLTVMIESYVGSGNAQQSASVRKRELRIPGCLNKDIGTYLLALVAAIVGPLVEEV